MAAALKWPSRIPSQPGVYAFFNSRGEILYLGKAKNLARRLAHYRGQGLDQKTQQFLRRSTRLRWRVTKNEFEALLLEARLIRRFRPRYNIRGRDQTRAPFIILEGKKFPRFQVRFSQKGKGKTWGPFVTLQQARQLLRALRPLFPFRDCGENKFKFWQQRQRGCLWADLGLCPAPCQKQISPSSYQKILAELELVLEGKSKILLQRWQRKMQQASRRLDFEKAAFWRDRQQALTQIIEQFSWAGEWNFPLAEKDSPPSHIFPLSPLRARLEAYDIAHWQGQQTTAALVYFSQGQAQPHFYRHFRLHPNCGGDDLAALREVLQRRLRHWGKKDFPPPPDYWLLDGGKTQLKVARSLLKGTNLKIHLLALAKKEERLFFLQKGKIKSLLLPSRPRWSRLLRQARDEAHRFARRYHHYLQKQQLKGG